VGRHDAGAALSVNDHRHAIVTLRSLATTALGRARRDPKDASPVDDYWNVRVVNDITFKTPQESEDYLEWRFREYPLFREFTGLWGDHAGETILDFGCGPGNDLVGLLLYSSPRKLIGVDVSRKALSLARKRLRLHGIDESSYELHRHTDRVTKLPIASESVDHINCQGVLHHTSEPSLLLREFGRVLTPSGRAVVMVYNRDSVYFHLYAAYMRMIVQGLFPGQSVEEAFARSTDGPECPISRAYRPDDFIALCESAGFSARFSGGYPAEAELTWMTEHLDDALASPLLAEPHKEFLREVTTDERGYPMYRGHHAGVGGVYHLSRV
jgi:ubiquinone/menaquinone biosynthesis C-methylase UbiE